LSGLKQLNDSAQGPLDITAIVTVSDSGGSTGALREALNMPAMGDIRKCMISLSARDSLLTSVCEHRFEHPEGFAGHSLGNLILSALYQMSGNFAAAVRQACDLLQLKGRVLPATETPVTLCALYEDGDVARGEVNIPKQGRRISRVWLECEDPLPPGEGGRAEREPDRAKPEARPGEGSHAEIWSKRALTRPLRGLPSPGGRGLLSNDPPAAPGVLEALAHADAIVIGPGSLYTSIIPNLLIAGVSDAIQASSAIRIYVSNLMTQVGETDGYTAADHVRAILDYLPSPSSVDVCVLNSSSIGMGVAGRYLKSGSAVVSGTAEDEDEIRRSGVIPVAAALLKNGEIKARHDPETLARLVVSLACGFAAAPEIICGQRNGR
jgi:2-phospho-L-lactate transferase/gluconeogenesis factor (CofD/UPF0052 family)